VNEKTKNETGSGETAGLEPDQIEALKMAVRIHGRNAKAAIRRAWFNGNYRAECLDDCSGSLQCLRNDFGPSWLCRISLKSLTTEGGAA
jgi:hypothetical protein